MSQDSSSDEEDISPLAYARLNGLSRDYLAERLGFAEIKKISKTADGVLSDDSHLYQFDLGTEFIVEEHLALPKEATPLLAWVTREETVEGIEALVAPIVDGHLNARKKKMELPLLRSDHEADCKQFARREGFEIRLHDIKLPLEVLNEQNNEGLTLSGRLWGLGF